MQAITKGAAGYELAYFYPTSEHANLAQMPNGGVRVAFRDATGHGGIRYFGDAEKALAWVRRTLPCANSTRWCVTNTATFGAWIK